MFKKNTLFKRILLSDLTYSFIFFSAYLSFFLDKNAGIFFALSFLLTFLLVKIKETFKKIPLLDSVTLLFLFVLGFYFYGTYQTIGFILGSSVSAFMMGNFTVMNKLSTQGSKEIGNLEEMTRVTLTNQIVFSFYYLYSLIIQDTRGQNNLENNMVIVSIAAFILSTTIIQVITKKLLYKRLDIISYSNFLFIVFSGICFAILYNSFLEVGAFNIILPIILSAFCIILITAFLIYSEKKIYNLKKTTTTLIYITLPMILLLYYPWNISKYLGMLFTSLTLVIFLSRNFVQYDNIELKFRLNHITIFIVNLTLILGSLFTLSTKGIITRLNIANIEYMLMLIFGIFVVLFLQDTRDSIKTVLLKYNLIGTYSVIVIALIALGLLIILDISGVEALGTFLFGLLATIFVKNTFVARIKKNQSSKKISYKNSTIAYTYLESNLLNLITALSMALMLVKI